MVKDEAATGGSSSSSSGPSDDGSTVSALTRATQGTRGSSSYGGRVNRNSIPASVVSNGSTSTDRKPSGRIKFEGREPKLAGHIFAYGGDAASGYIKTVEELLMFAGTEYKYGDEIARCYLDGLLKPQFPKPAVPETDPTAAGYDRTEHELWKEKIKLLARKEDLFEMECKQFYATVWKQCTEMIQNKVKAIAGYSQFEKDKNPMKLLEGIKTVMFNVQSERKLSHTLYENDLKLYTTVRRQPHWTLPYYHKRFKTHIEVIESVGGSIVMHPAMVAAQLEILKEEVEAKSNKAKTVDVDNPTADEKRIAEDWARDEYIGLAFIMGSGAEDYIVMLENEYVHHRDIYPTSLDDAFTKLMNYKSRGGTSGCGTVNDGAAFATIAEGQEDGDEASDAMLATMLQQSPPLQPTPQGRKTPGGRDVSNMTCWRCGKKGHLKGDPACEKTPQQASLSTLVHAGIARGDGDESIAWTLVQRAVGRSDQDALVERIVLTSEGKVRVIPSGWVLLDTCSTIDLFCDPRLVRNIRRSKNRVAVHSNGGVSYTDLIADVPGYPFPVWFSHDAIANILGVCNVVRAFRVTFDSEGGNEFLVQKPDGGVRRFIMSGRGLYHCDVLGSDAVTLVEDGVDEEEATTEMETEVRTLETVEDRKSRYTNRDYLRAVEARRFQETAGFPSIKDLLRHIDQNLIKNCPVRAMIMNYPDPEADEDIMVDREADPEMDVKIGLGCSNTAIPQECKSKVTTIITDHGKFTLDEGSIKGDETALLYFDEYDHSNCKDAKKFIYNSVDDDLKNQLNENCEKNCSFITYWLELIHTMQSVSMERFETIKDRIKGRKITDYSGENVELIVTDYLSDWEQLDSASMYEHSLTMTMLNAILQAGGTDNEGFKFPLRSIKMQLV